MSPFWLLVLSLPIIQLCFGKSVSHLHSKRGLHCLLSCWKKAASQLVSS